MKPQDIIDATEKLVPLCEQAGQNLRQIESWLWRNVVANDVFPRSLPTEIEPHLSALREHLQSIQGISGNVKEICLEPAFKFIHGQMLSEEEFHILESFSAIHLHTGERRDYDVFKLFHYDDGSACGYIDAREPLQTGHVRMGVGNEIAPEDINVQHLQAEQREFFARFLPDAYARFRR